MCLTLLLVLYSLFSISWEYNQETQVLSIDQYENLRPPRRTHFEMILPRSVRQEMLRKEWNITQAQIASSVRNNVKIKNQRRMTISNLGKASVVEERMESISRGLKRGLFLRKSTDKQVRELEAKVDEAERMRAKLYIDCLDVEDTDEDEEDVITTGTTIGTEPSEKAPIIASEGDECDMLLKETNESTSDSLASPERHMKMLHV
jgi:hypothetical protein